MFAVATLAWLALYLLGDEIIFWHFSNAKLPSVLSEVKNFRNLHLLEERHEQTAQAGIYIKPFRGLTDEIDCQSLRLSFSEVFWCIPPPSGEELKIRDDDGKESAPPRPVFYACTASSLAGKRLFFFHGRLPKTGQWFCWALDEELSWYFQTPLEFLDPDEREIEQDYREQEDLKFPLGTLGSNQ